MIKESDAIVLVEVTEGGKFIAKVKTEKTFKGNPPNEFYVTGYNNFGWPRDAIEKESFKNKQRYYLFARGSEHEGELDILSDIATEDGDSKLKAVIEKARSSTCLSAWTPSSGDLPVDGQNVHYSLLQTSYPHAAVGRSCAEFERFLNAAIEYQSAGKTDDGLLNETLQAIRKQSQKSGGVSAKESELAFSISAYFLLGGGAYDEVFEKIATSNDGDARLMLARLLGTMKDERANKLLLSMLADKSSVVQGEVVRQLAKGDPNKIGEVLLSRLGSAGEDGVYPKGIMDPVRNQLDGGKVEIIRALGELKYQPAQPALIRLVEDANDMYSLTVLLEALEKMGDHDYGRALEKPLSKEPLISEISSWVRDHHVVGAKSALEQILDRPPEGVRRGIDLGNASEALGVIGDENTAAKITACLERESSKKVADVGDLDVARDMVGALAALHYKPGHSAVARSFFYWFGIDSAFATKPELVKTKEQLEQEVQEQTKKNLPEFRKVDPEVLVYLQNRAELIAGSEREPRYSFALAVGIHSQEHPELKAAALQARLEKAFGARAESVSVTRWIHEGYGESNGNDGRLGGRSDMLYFWRWAQYVQATRDPEDFKFAKFLLESGLAERWGGKDSVEKVFGSTPIE